MLTRKDVSVRLSISASALDRIVREGKLPCYKIGGSIRFQEEDVEKYFKACRLPFHTPTASTASIKKSKKRTGTGYVPGMKVVKI